MHNTPLIRLSACALAALLTGCATTPTPRPPLKLTVLHTNDHHGRFWPNADGEYGMAARKTLIDRLRAEVKASGGEVLLLDGGDVNTGVPESDLQDAEPDLQAMNRIGYDAMAVGNHEFDKSPAVLAKQRSWLKFPMLSANIYKDGQRLFEPYRIFERAGYKIAVMGLTTDDTQKMVLPDNIRGITFTKPAAEAAKLVPELRAKAVMVIATTHMGHYTDGQAGVNAAGDVEMARAVKGLDLVVGGHSQNPVCMLGENKRNDAYVPGSPCAPDRQNGAWIVQAHEWGKYVGRADFVIDGPKIELVRYELLPVNMKKRAPDGKKVPAGETIAEDAEMKAYLQPFQANGQARLAVPVGATDGVLDGDRERVRKQPTTLGTLIARAMMDKTGADLALINSGGVRDSLPAGQISYRDVLKVQPFGNTVAIVQMKGAELLTYLKAAAKMTPGSGAFPQTAGVRLVIEAGELKDARIGNQAIDPLRDYRLALTNFTATGGDGYPKLNTHPGYVDSGFNDADVLRAYIAKRSPLKVADYEPGDAVTRR
ncbi:bifunctional UDP-sugar hydrolase/5'-nucleotidase [Aquincola sp. S2]|uniref:Bifunctional UDP-sugar hydrolase/5'-nucleotidase n=1 Tax=Pseudaquabacterium terrae TaxID=2732868 RepID=A0ABX2EKW4_9BURK|nr:bifunctional UDP-sugar hydrolase/5'-nucleotidase UshA [Aquabacterium terrae]NRF69238.1 bifunctional UDP-sugar hydrolase/5'-nucleotidase [Aquabacterium terrae]